MADIEAAQRCGTDSVHISFPVSKILLGTVGKDERWLFSACETIVAHAAKRFGFVSVGGQDAMRADRSLVRRFARHAAQCGAQRFRVADTVGIAVPHDVGTLIQTLKKPGMPSLEFHAHNDLGMASANAYTAVKNGAAVSVTVNGLGERAGNAALEEVAMALNARSPASVSRYDMKMLPDICSYVAKAAGRPLCRSKPIVGDGIFDHESGIHIDGLMKNPVSYQPFLPAEVGRRGYRTVIGYHTGASAVMKALGDAGIKVSRIKAAGMVDAVRSAARRKKRSLTKQELKRICLNMSCSSGKKTGSGIS
jgi:homocitrate synthase NifV